MATKISGPPSRQEFEAQPGRLSHFCCSLAETYGKYNLTSSRTGTVYSSSSSESLQPRASAPDDSVLTGAAASRAQIGVFAGHRDEVRARLDAISAPMAVISYGSNAEAFDGVPLNICVPLEPVAGGPETEIWYAQGKVTTGTSHGVAYAQADDAVIGYLSLAQGNETLEGTAQRAYAQILSALDEVGCPHLLRVWNYFSAINADEQGMERYQRFCVGRHRAFEHHYRNRMIERLPAASAIGTSDSELIVYFIASRNPGQHLENPRQVSAYCYPKEYGPASPTFSRATVKHWARVPALYLSGTASVVGHKSLHANDLEAQTRETISNIRALFAAIPPAQRVPNEKTARVLKIYVRNVSDMDAVRALVSSELGDSVTLLTLQGDICRRELLLEIEGVYGA